MALLKGGRRGLQRLVTRVLPTFVGLAFAALLVVWGPAGAEAGQPVNQTYTCPGGSFLTGLQGRAGDWLDQFQPICRSWSPAGGTGGETYGDNFGNVNGGNRAVRAPCVAGSAMRGISYNIVEPHGFPGHVNNVFVRCAKLPSVYPDYADIPLDCPFGSHIAGSFCGGSQVATVAKGLVIGLDGINITSLQLECDTVDNIVAAAAPSQPRAPKAGPVCPTGWMKVVDPKLLPADWETKAITAGGITIVCGKRRIIRLTPSQINKLTPILRVPTTTTTKSHHACDPGTVWANGHCVPACPDGSVMPPNGSCGGSKSQPDHPCGPRTVWNGWRCAPACPDGTPVPKTGACPPAAQTSDDPCDRQLRLPDGSCPKPPPRLVPRTTTPTINLHNARKLMTCDDGQPRQADGDCPPPKPKFHLKNIYRPPIEQPK